MEPGMNSAAWSPLRRILFRWYFSYFVLYWFPYPLSEFPGVSRLVGMYDRAWHVLVRWVGAHVFHAKISILLHTGSGDTSYKYLRVLCYIAIAIVATLVWSALDRRRRNYVRLHAWLRIYLRYCVATAMVFYGALKVINDQFPGPPLWRMVEPFGEASPMGLLWTFMATSDVYCIVSGVSEMLGGLLLTTRRTSLAGAFLSAVILVNVVLMNFSYDVPVKLFSCHLLATSIYLVAFDSTRLANLFLFNRPTQPAALGSPPRRNWLGYGIVIARTLLVVGYVWFSLDVAYHARVKYGNWAPRSPAYGIWNVEQFELDGTDRPALVTDADRWRRVIFDSRDTLTIQIMSDRCMHYDVKPAAQTNMLALVSFDDPELKSALSYESPEPGVLSLEGTWDGHAIRARLRRTETRQFPLRNRGFHLISEKPYNR